MMDTSDDALWQPAQRAYLELPGTGVFIGLAEGGDRLHVQRGIVGRPALELRTAFLTPGRSAGTFAEALQTVRSWGFADGAPRQPVHVGCVAHQLVSTAIADHPDHAEIFEIGPAADWREGAPRRLLHFRDGLVFDGDLDLELLADLGLAVGAIIEGPVRVSGVLSQTGLDVLGAVLVRGDVSAASFVHRDGHIRITGDLRVRHAIWGQYNDGCLEVQGDAVADAWIGADNHDMRAARVVARATEPEHLLPELLDAEGQPESSALMACIGAGRSPARPDLSNPGTADQEPAAGSGPRTG